MDFSSNSKYFNNGVINNKKFQIKNVSSEAKNSEKFKNKDTISFAPSFQTNYTYPLQKQTEKFNYILAPKFALNLSIPHTKDVHKDQLEIVNGLELNPYCPVAYEPVWAIGSGLTPEPKDVNEIHKYIKDVVQSNSENNLLPKVLYGGSVNEDNAESFFKEEFVDVALIGGASLDGKLFANIVNIYNEIKSK